MQQFSFFKDIPRTNLMSILYDVATINYNKEAIIYDFEDRMDYIYFLKEG